MGKSNKKVPKHSKEPKEDSIIIVNELNQVSTPTLEFDEVKYLIWESKMVVYLQDHGYYIW